MDAICSRVIPGKLRGKLLSRNGCRASRLIDRRLATIEGRQPVNRASNRIFRLEIFTYACTIRLGIERVFSRDHDSVRGAETSRQKHDERSLNECSPSCVHDRSQHQRARHATNDAGRGTCLSD